MTEQQQVMAEGLRHLAGEFSVSRDEWRQHFRGGDMLLDGLVSKGYALHQRGRFAVSRQGRAFLQAVEVPDDGE